MNKNDKQIKRTLESVVGNELIPGRDENGDFKIEIQKLLLGFENYISETPAPKKVPRSDESGKLDIGWFDATETPEHIELLNAITYLSKSGHNSQAIVSNGKLYTTSGNNANYWTSTTGRHTNAPTHYGVDSFKIVQLPQDSPIKKVGGFVNGYAFALLEDGRLYTWGYNLNGQCGLGHTNPVAIPTLAATNVIDVYSHPSQGEYYVGNNRLFILKSDGLYGAGYNAGGQLGVGDAVNKSTFTKCTVFTSSAEIKKVYPIGCTSGYTFVLTTDGKIYFAGTNNTGVAGDGTTANKTSFTDVTSYWAGVSSGVLDIKVVGGTRWYDGTNDGGAQPAAIMLITLSDSTTIVKACGLNNNGQLGDGTTTQRTIPVTPLNVPGGSIVDIAGFGGISLIVQALASNGDLWAWGANGQGQVGDGTTTNRTTPIVVTTGVQKLFSDGMSSHINCHLTQSFIRKADGLYACGYNAEGYCGLGHVTTPITTHTKVPLYLSSDEYVEDIGHYTTQANGRIIIAVTNKGNLFAWGFNGNYGVGGNTTNNVLVPIQFTIQEGV
jgi:alpha-tubulin suppressor-like RCC1 family protein